MKAILTIVLTILPLSISAQVDISLRTDNSTYGYGNAAEVCIDITNTGDETINHEVEDCQYPIQIDDNMFLFNQFKLGSCQLDCSHTIQEFVIDPGATLSICTSFWVEDQEMCSMQSPYAPDVDFAVQDMHTISAFGEELNIFIGGLAVDYGSISGYHSDQSSVLEWTTLNEENNIGFEIERSLDGPFETIGFVDGNLNSNTESSYSFTDLDSFPGKAAIYRLKQIDSDGSFRYSKEVEIVHDIESAFILRSAYPNPFSDRTTFNLTVKNEQDLDVSLYDQMGRQVKTVWNGHMRAHETRVIEIQADELPSGTYFYQVKSDEFQETRSLSLNR